MCYFGGEIVRMTAQGPVRNKSILQGLTPRQRPAWLQHLLRLSKFVHVVSGWLTARRTHPGISPNVGGLGSAINMIVGLLRSAVDLVELAANPERLVKPASRHMETRT